MTLSWPQYESKPQWRDPIKKKRGKKSEIGIEKDNAE
jgi:hypothetical protein